MILKKIDFTSFRSFAAPTTLEFEKITVLTGGNDVGKSSILRFLQILYGPTIMEEFDVDYNIIGQSPWQTNEKLGGTATFLRTAHSQQYFNQKLEPSDHLLIKAQFAPNKWARHCQRVNGNAKHDVGLVRMPKVLVLSGTDQIGDIIKLAEPTHAETELLQTAFGIGFDFKNIKNLRPQGFTQQLAAAKAQINKRLKQILPESMRIELHFEGVEGRRDNLAVFVSDIHAGHTPLSSRGAGVKKILTLLSSILALNIKNEHLLIIADEPENSLHADAQHKFRAFLELMAERETVQVIYATHSSAMINSFYPKNVRLVGRASSGDKAHSTITNAAASKNWTSVRSSLGISPADSLLYAPITIIIEGETEAVAVPLALRKLNEEKISGFEQVPRLFSQCHFLDGMGDNFEFWCRLAKSQGSKPIIFVDGDKIRRVKQTDVARRHPEVPILHLPAGQEFENIVPQTDYFRAIAEAIGRSDVDAMETQFAEWEKNKVLPRGMLYSKRIDMWLTEFAPDFIYSKPAVMKAAIELIDIKKIRLDELTELVKVVAKMGQE